MVSVNIRELRDTKRLKAWLQQGKTVKLRDRQKVIARIVPEGQQNEARPLPDFAARQKKLFGNRTFHIVDDLIRERGRY